MISSSTESPNPQTWKLVEDTILGNGVTFLSTPCGPNCTYHTAFHGPGLDCESHPNYKMSARCQNCPSFSASFEARINTSASPTDLPRDWIWPGSPEFLEQKTFPLYASFIDDSNVSTLWMQYLQNDSVSPISNSAMMSFEPTQADQAWQTLACTLQNTTYSVDVSFQDWVPTVNAKMVSSTPLSTIAHSEFSYDVQNAQYLDPTTAFFEGISGSIYADTVNHSITGVLGNGLGVFYSNLANMTTTPANFTENLIWSVTSNFTAAIPENLIWSVTSNFTTAIPELLTNITLNIMAMNRPTYNTTCNSTRTEIVYQYRSQYLLLTYGLGFLATLCCFAAGVYALRDNGVAMECTFSEIVAATQNPALGQALANEGYSRAARESAAYLEQRVMYGELVEEDGDEDRSRLSKGVRRAAFGLQGQIVKMEKAS